MADVDMKRLPSVAEGKAIQYARHGKPEPVKAPSRRRPTQDKARAPSHATRQTVRVIGSVVRPAAGAARAATRSTGGLVKGAGKALGGIVGVLKVCSAARAHARRTTRRLRSTPAARRPSRRGRTPRAGAEIGAAAKISERFSREVPDEKQRDAEIERDRKGRERTRGE